MSVFLWCLMMLMLVIGWILVDNSEHKKKADRLCASLDRTRAGITVLQQDREKYWLMYYRQCQENAKLSRRIHNQRVTIKKLKANEQDLEHRWADIETREKMLGAALAEWDQIQKEEK